MPTRCKKVLETYKTKTGAPEASIVAKVKHFLVQFKMSHAAYNGVDFDAFLLEN